MKLVLPLAMILSLGATSMALADDDCRSPMGQWQSREAASAHVQSLGISPDRLRIDDGCYEVRGRDTDGNLVELKLDPASLALMELDIQFRAGSDPARYLAGARGQGGMAGAAPSGAVPQVTGN
jgi:hypothetical protein